MPDFIDMLLRGGSPTTTQFLNPLNGLPPGRTPGFNPNAPLPGVSTPVKPQSGFNKLLSNPMLLNILAQSGRSLTPGPSPLGVIGRAGLATQQQNQQTEQNELHRQFIESQVLKNKADAFKSLQPSGTQKDAVTDLGKLQQDLANGIISAQDYQAKRQEILSANTQRGFDNEKVLREEFGKRTKGVSDSLQSLSQAEALLSTSENPVAELAAFISFIKAIDNSTVREGELNNFASVSGILSTLQTLATRAQGKGAFEGGVREDIEDALVQLRRNLEKMHSGFAEFYGQEAQRFNLSPRAVTGAPVAGFGGKPGAKSTPPAPTPGNITAPPQDPNAEDFT